MIGREQALEFVGRLPRSGSRPWRACIYIPRCLSADHKLVRMLGWETATRLCSAFAGMILQPSTLGSMERAHRNRQIIRAMGEGVPIKEVADVYEMSRYQIRDIMRHNANHRAGDHP